MRNFFPKNTSNVGRILRFTAGVLLLAYAYWQMSWIALAFAIFLFFEAAMSWCVVYQLWGAKCCCKKK